MADRYFTTSDGVRLHYTVSGEGKRNLVLLPGLGQPASGFDMNIPAFTETHTVYALDYRNHGLSEDTLKGNHIERFAKDLMEMISDARLIEFDLAAHSMGNAVAWCYMELFGTGKIRKYVLEEEGPILLSDPSWTEEEKLTYRGLNDWPSFIPVNDPSNKREAGIARLWHDHVNRDWRDIFEMIRMPVLVIMGDRSHYASEFLWNFLKKELPTASLISLDAGHLVHGDCPEEFNRAVVDFLNKDI